MMAMPVAFIENIFGVRFSEATRAVRLTSEVFRGMLSFFMTGYQHVARIFFQSN
jgi:hypothetical protein